MEMCVCTVCIFLFIPESSIRPLRARSAQRGAFLRAVLEEGLTRFSSLLSFPPLYPSVSARPQTALETISANLERSENAW